MRKIKKILLLASISAVSSTVMFNRPIIKVYAAEEIAGENLASSSNVNIYNEGITKEKSKVEISAGEDANLKAKGDLSKSNANINKNSDSLNQTTNAIASSSTDIDGAVNRINEGSQALSDYAALGLKKVKTDNVKVVAKAISDEKTALNRNLTLVEIMDVVSQTVEAIQEAFSNINLGQGTINDYKLLQVDFVNDVNLQSVNDYFKDKRYTTITKITSVASKISTALSNINNGSGEQTDYDALEIGEVNSSYIYLVNKNIMLEKERLGRDLTITEVTNVVNTTIERVKDILDKLNLGIATLDDYDFIEATNVTELHLDDVNSLAKDQRWTQVSTAIDGINYIVSCLDNINSGGGTESDYWDTHIVDASEENLDFDIINEAVINERANKGEDLTIPEIAQVVRDVKALLTFYDHIDAGTVTVTDFDNVGLQGVQEGDVADLSDMVKNRECKTIKALQDKLNPVLNSVKNINEGTDGTLDYTNLKIDGVDDSKLSAVKENIQKLKIEKGRNLTIAEIRESAKKTIDYINSSSDVIDGKGNLNDYIIIGISGVTEINIEFINARIREDGSISIENYKIVVQQIVQVSVVYVRIVSGQGTLADYEKLGIKNVNESNIIYINADLKDKKYVNIQDIQVRISETIVNIDIINRISAGNATVDEYINIGVTDIYEDILLYVNADLKIQNYKAVDEIISRVQSKISIYEALMRINIGEAIIDDYIALGLTDISDSLLIYVNTDLQYKNYTTIEEVVARVKANINIYKSLMKINLGQAVIEDYTSLGFSQINASILVYVNADLQGKRFLTIEEVKARIIQNIQIYNVLLKINLGQATIENYRLIGVTEIIDYNISYVNIRIKNVNITEVTDVKRVISTILNNMIFSSVSGVVTDAKTGTPLDGVEIKFRLGDNNTSGEYFSKNGVPVVAIMDAQGKYSIQLPEGSYTVEIKKTGYITKNFVITSDGKTKNILQNIQLQILEYSISGVVKDAQTGNPLEGVAIRFRLGENNKSGEYYSVNGNEIVVYTDAQGKYTVSLAGGTYTAEAKKDGNITLYSVIISSEEATKILHDMVLTKTLPENQYRVVLTWGENPRDLDSYFTGTTGNGQSIRLYYSDPVEVIGDTVATLDTDDTNGYGPETVTFTPDSNGNYTYSVFDQSNKSTSSSNLLSLSGATVKVYKGNEELMTYVIPSSVNGILWTVFKIENGQLIDVNTITSGQV